MFLVNLFFLDILGNVCVPLLPQIWLSVIQSHCWLFGYYLMPRVKFPYLVISLSQFWEDCFFKLITRTVSFSLPMSVVSGLLKSTVLSVMIDLSLYINMLADSSTGSGLLLLLHLLSSLCKVFTVIYLKHTTFLQYIVLQLFSI